MKYLTILIIGSLLLVSCLDDCPNIVSRDLTQTDLDWFAREPNDTTFFKDAESGEIYYLACESCETGEMRHFVDENHCKNEGYYRIRKYIYSEYNSNLPHYLNDMAKININFETAGISNSGVEFLFTGSRASTYTYFLNFYFKQETETIEETDFYDTPDIIHKDSVLINGKMYDNVFILVFYPGLSAYTEAFFDTLYYNPDGFLKFISSQYGYRLERME